MLGAHLRPYTGIHMSAHYKRLSITTQLWFLVLRLWMSGC
jgi:hypothetical protein